MGMGEYVSQQTVIRNGQQKIITKKTTLDKCGNQSTQIMESFQDPHTGEIIENKYLENG